MSLLVTGSIGLDTIETPAGKRENVVGGSAVYFSYAASFFTPVRLVGVVGDDSPRPIWPKFLPISPSISPAWKFAKAPKLSAGTAPISRTSTKR